MEKWRFRNLRASSNTYRNAGTKWWSIALVFPVKETHLSHCTAGHLITQGEDDTKGSEGK